MPVPIRPARPEERTALEALQLAASLAGGSQREAVAAHPDVVRIPATQITAGQVLVAEMDGGLAGFIVAIPSGNTTEIDGLFVAPGLWRRGIGRALIVRGETEARARGSAALTVVADPDAAAFYRACGFREAGTTSTRFGPAITMEKPLRAG